MKEGFFSSRICSPGNQICVLVPYAEHEELSNNLRGHLQNLLNGDGLSDRLALFATSGVCRRRELMTLVMHISDSDVERTNWFSFALALVQNVKCCV